MDYFKCPDRKGGFKITLVSFPGLSTAAYVCKVYIVVKSCIWNCLTCVFSGMGELAERDGAHTPALHACNGFPVVKNPAAKMCTRVCALVCAGGWSPALI